MKGYSVYKESGYDWTGNIPEHWNMVQFKFAAPRKTEQTENVKEFGLQIALENIESKTGRLIQNGSFEGLGYIFRKGDVLFNKLRPYLCKVVIAPESGVAVSDLLVLRPSVFVDKRYLFYRMLESNFISVVNGSTYGAKMPRASWDFIGNLKTPIPPIPEQQAIADFLDRKTAQIDTLIAKKQRQVDLLQEKRTALINQVVTKGLNPVSSLKYSGFDWLGEIPSHWEVLPLKYLLRDGNDGIKIGPFGSSLKLEIIKAEGYKVYGQGNVINDDFILGNRYIDENKFFEMCVYELFPGDVVITMMGTTGKSKVVPEGIKRGIIDSHLIRIRVNPLTCAEFISWLINDSHYISTQVKMNGKGSIMEGLNSLIVKSLIIALPPLSEQKMIIHRLNQESTNVDKAIQKLQVEIELLQEYRTATIFNAVTGKIDVQIKT